MKTGDIYAFYNERLDLWHACQITGFCSDGYKDMNGRPKVAVLLFDWAEKRRPTLTDFSTLRPFRLKDNSLYYRYCSGLKPQGFTYCGNYSLLAEGEVKRSYGTWFCVKDIFPLEINTSKNIEKPFKEAKGQLDFRGTESQSIGIDVTGVKEIFLHDVISSLGLKGRMEPDLQIHDPHHGRFLHLGLKGGFRIPKGLEQLQGLSIVEIAEIDLAEVLKNHKDIDNLSLSGRPGNIKSFSAISTLKKLRSLIMRDLFGYSADELPTPEDLPALESLWLHSIPFDVAQRAKKLYKPLVKDDYAFELDVIKARKPEWLAENLNNPFCSWDGDEMLPKGTAKKAFDIYKKTRTGLVGLSQADGANIFEESLTLCKSYVEAFNTIDRKHECFETVYAEDIMGALNRLITEIASGNEKLDAQALIEVCDGLREF